MKKYITIAALFTTGIVFANAETITFEKTTWSAGTNTVALTDPTTVSTTAIEGLESWEISFDWSYKAGTNSNKWGSTILATGTDPFASGGYSGGFQIRWNNGTENNKKDGMMFIVANGKGDYNSLTLGTISDFASNDYDFNFTISYDIDTKALNFVVKYGDTILDKTLTSTNEVAISSFSTGTSTYGTVGTYSNLTGSYIIPEPSAFGLLAGVGALALVASRRRRR